ncbi:hypothetical protein SAMN05444161_2654 [Rhizobiales bacterium GAS191]|nr:hypothetical protein SAMN05444161_2654 [Rhizobiales bacterium GAS191]
MPRFSDRMGITKPKLLQLRSLDAELRASLWNLCRKYWFISSGEGYEIQDDVVYDIAVDMYENFYKKPVENLPRIGRLFVKEQLEYFEEGDWYMVLNLLEFLHDAFQPGSIHQQEFVHDVNLVLEREKSGYRFVAGKIAPLTNEIEMEEVERASTQIARFAPVSEHINTAIELYSKRPEADYRNSVKESISAVEASAKIITGLAKSSLAEALGRIDARHPMHKAFKKGVLNLYGYTSDESGIRHSLMEEAVVDEADARYMLVSCSAFTNYLISRDLRGQD